MSEVMADKRAAHAEVEDNDRHQRAEPDAAHATAHFCGG